MHQEPEQESGMRLFEVVLITTTHSSCNCGVGCPVAACVLNSAGGLSAS